MKRYEGLAEEIGRKIMEGALLPGDRLPSVRKLSRAHRVSPMTVAQAYRVLEDGGQIQTRPRSGHYVRAQRRLAEALPATSRPTPKPTAVVVRDLAQVLSNAASHRNVMAFGSAFPGPELFPHAKLAQALYACARKLDPRSIYDHPLGNAELRRLISRRYLEFGCIVAPTDIIVTNGALEALNLCLAAVTQPGDLVAVECPAFYLALEAIERLGLKAVEITTHPCDGVCLEALAKALDQYPIKACWFMTSFSNPLGCSIPDAKKRELVGMLAGRNIPLIEDDVYAELHFAPDPVRPAKSFDRAGGVLHCGSFSKSLAPGYRVGWAAPGRYAAKVERAKIVSSIATSNPAQGAIAEFLKHGGNNHHLRLLRRALAASQLQMLTSIQRYFPAGTRTTAPAGGYFLWVELPTKVNALRLHELALEKKISVAPGPLFCARGQIDHFIRLNYGLAWTPRVETSMSALGKLACSLA